MAVSVWGTTGNSIVYKSNPPRVPKSLLHYSVFRTAPVLVAEVFGHSDTCSAADPELVSETASAALEAHLDPQILAATVVVESACNPYAISSRGAVGLGQVHIDTWKNRYDFQGDDNPFNPQTNLRMSAHILADLTTQYGIRDGLYRYQGTGIGGDADYVNKIMVLARRQ